MKNKKYKPNAFRVFEVIITIAIWAFMLFLPLIFVRDNNHINWTQILRIWKDLMFLLPIYLINRFILLPHLFFRNNRLLYVISIIFLIALMSLFSFLFTEKPLPGLPVQQERPMIVDSRPVVPRPLPLPPFANRIIMSLLLIGVDVGLVLTAKYIKAEKDRVIAEKEMISTKLTMLQNQISPHFLMNTLNNIHALIDFNSEEAKKAVIELSKMMRHLLYGTETGKLSLKKEIAFLESYIDLMKLRFPENVKISVTLPDDIPNREIPSLLFTSLIENAFKHGINYGDDSFISIALYVDENNLTFNVENSKHEHNSFKDDSSGIGLKNTKKRLDLLYGNNYQLKIDDRENTFNVTLIIPI